MKSGQKGFTIVETLLVLILAGIIGFTGYYVYHTRNNATATYNNAASADSATASSSNKATPQVYYFKELGVYITLTKPPLYQNLNYELSKSDGTQYLDLFTPATQEALNKCDPGATSGIFMSIAKIPGQFNQDQNPGIGNLKQFKDFWISGATPNGIVCTGSDKDKANWDTVFHAHVKAVQEAFKTATQ